MWHWIFFSSTALFQSGLGVHYGSSLGDELDEIAAHMGRSCKLVRTSFRHLQEHWGRGAYASRLCPAIRPIEGHAMDGDSPRDCWWRESTRRTSGECKRHDRSRTTSRVHWQVENNVHDCGQTDFMATISSTRWTKETHRVFQTWRIWTTAIMLMKQDCPTMTLRAKP